MEVSVTHGCSLKLINRSHGGNGEYKKKRMNNLRTVAVFFIVGALNLHLQAYADESGIVLEAGQVTVRYQPRRFGMRIDLDGMPFSRHSELVVTTPPWTPHFYVGPTAEAVAAANVEETATGITLTVIHKGQDAFVGTETLRLARNGLTLRHTFKGEFMRDGEALIQWRMAALDATLLMGRSFEATGRDGEAATGILPVAPQPAESYAARMAHGFSSFSVDSRLGKVEILVRSQRALTVRDYRASKWAVPGDAYFWFGDWGSRITRENPTEYEVIYQFPKPSERAQVEREMALTAEVEPLEEAQTTRRARKPVVMPNPKRADWQPDELRIDAGSAPLIEGSVSATVNARLTDLFGPRQVATEDADSSVKMSIQTVAAESVHGIEGYKLTIDDAGIRIEAAGERGQLHAARTLKQVARRTRDGGWAVRKGHVEDWPDLAFRGVHFFTGGKGPDIQIELIHKLLGALKMNHLVLEAEYIQWDNHPELHHPSYGMPKEDVRMILSACRDEAIEVTPLINTLGHCQWMFETGHHLDICEDPVAKWAYCVTNPKSYELVFSIFAETLELFQPKYLHIGHDEFADRGRVPFRESSKPYTIEQLLMMDTLKLHAWLKERNVGTMMWGDMLLAKGEAPDACNAESKASALALREELPDDVVITDWHYANVDAERFISLKTFKEEGHPVVAATWNRPTNIVNFAHAASDAGALGLLQTTWAGYSLDADSFAKEMHQYGAYVLAAEAAWNAANPPAAEMAVPSWRFLDLMELSALRPGHAKGWSLDLARACNYSRSASNARGWFGYGQAFDLSMLPAGRQNFEGVTFDIRGGALANVLALHGKLAADLHLPTSVTIKTKAAPATSLVILQTTNFAAASRTKIATYQLQFADGSRESIDLIYGENVLSFNDLSMAPNAPVVWHGRTGSGDLVAARALVWNLKNSTAKIESIAFQSAGAGPSPVILAVTALCE